MRNYLLMLMAFLLINSQQVLGQDKQIKGKVSDESGEGIPGATITVKEVAGIGTITDFDGFFTLKVPSEGKTLVCSFVGMVTQEIPLGTSNEVNVTLLPDNVGLEEIVVTAMGIERPAKSIGYKVVEVGADETVQKSEPDMLKSLQGKVPGVQIQGSSSAPGSATRITIRGVTSFFGDNQPLFVVDNIPYSNVQYNTAEQSTIGGAYSTGISTLDPNSIESIRVLKGAAAAALYGSRASNGVVLITTKAGSPKMSNKGLEVTYSASYSQSQVNLPTYQNKYGVGHNNTFSQGDNGSWGAPFSLMDSIPQWDVYLDQYPDLPSKIPYEAQKDNVKNLFKKGEIWEHSITAEGGNENSRFSMTLSKLDQSGIIPNSEFGRNSINLGASTKLSNGLKVGGSFSYAKTKQEGAIYGYAYSANEGAASSFARTMWLSRSWDMDLPYETPDGKSLFYMGGVDNPLWSWKHNRTLSNSDRITSQAYAEYDILSWIKFKALYGVNTLIDSRQQINDIGSSSYRGLGHMKDGNIWEQEQEAVVTLTATKKLSSKFNVRAVGGYNFNQFELDRQQNDGSQFIAEGIYNMTNTLTQSSDPVYTYFSKSRLYAFFGDVQIGFNDYLFLDITGRNDWSSTLPKENNSYFYSSYALAFIFTDALKINSDVLSFGKLNISYGKVGRDADPYSLRDVYNINFYGEGWSSSLKDVGLPFNGQPGLTKNNIKADPNLTPEFTTSTEIGTELHFFKSRMNLDITLYQNESTDLITDITIPESTGFSSYYTNFGEMKNKGIEIALGIIPIKTMNGLTWSISGTYDKNINEVTFIADGIDQNTLKPLFSSLSPVVQVGQPYGIFYGDQYLEDDEGNYLVDPQTGTYINDNDQGVIGDPNPDFRASLINTISYKGFSLTAVIDYRHGGDVYSFGVERLLGRGVTKDTEDRDELYILPGNFGDPNGQKPLYDENGEKIPNNVAITTNEYYFNVLGFGNDQFSIYDGTNIRLREISLSYQLPRKLIDKWPIGSASISITGRNLWYYCPHIPKYTNFDPEVNTFGSDNATGLDFGNAPSLRRIGASLKISF